MKKIISALWLAVLGAVMLAPSPASADMFPSGMQRVSQGLRYATATPRAPRWLFATSNSVIATTVRAVGASSSQTSFIGRAPFRVGGAPTSAEVMIANWQLNTGGSPETNMTGSWTLSALYLECGSKTTQLTIAGATTATIGNSSAYVLSDPITAQTACGSPDFAGQTLFVREGGVVPATSSAALASFTNPAGTTGGSIKFYDPTAQTTDPMQALSGTGALATPTSGANPAALALPGVAGIVGLYNQPQRSVIAIGDSICAYGFPNYASVGSAGTSDPIPTMVICKIGAQIQEYVASHAYRQQMLQFASILLSENGTNDIQVGSRTASQIWSDEQTLYSAFRTSSPGGKVLRTKMLPDVSELYFTSVTASGGTATGTLTTVTSATPTALLASGQPYQIVNILTAGYNSSSVVPTILDGTRIQWPVTAADGTATLGGSNISAVSDGGRSLGTQVPLPQWLNSSGTRDQLIALHQAGFASGVIDAFPDTLTPVAANDNHYWAATGTGGLNSGTTNSAVPGPHPSTAGQQAIGAVVRSAELGLAVQ